MENNQEIEREEEEREELSESEFREVLMCAIGESEDIDELDDCEVGSFRDYGIMTTNEGLVVRLQSGEEFQITIVRSR